MAPGVQQVYVTRVVSAGAPNRSSGRELTVDFYSTVGDDISNGGRWVDLNRNGILDKEDQIGFVIAPVCKEPDSTESETIAEGGYAMRKVTADDVKLYGPVLNAVVPRWNKTLFRFRQNAEASLACTHDDEGDRMSFDWTVGFWARSNTSGTPFEYMLYSAVPPRLREYYVVQVGSPDYPLLAGAMQICLEKKIKDAN